MSEEDSDIPGRALDATSYNGNPGYLTVMIVRICIQFFWCFGYEHMSGGEEKVNVSMTGLLYVLIIF